MFNHVLNYLNFSGVAPRIASTYIIFFSLQILSRKKKLFVNSNHVDNDKFDINHEGVSNHAAKVFFFLTTLTQAGMHGNITVPMCLGQFVCSIML